MNYFQIYGGRANESMEENMKIYLARHGKDEDGYRGGWSMRGLTDTGKNQVEILGNHLYNYSLQYNIKTIFSSDLTRAKETAQPISEKLDIKIEYIEDLREMNNGDLAGLQNDIANEKYPGLYFNSLAMDEKYPNGESPNEFFNRISRFLEELIEDMKAGKFESNVLLMTHGGVINIIYYIIKKLEWTNQVISFPCNNTSLHCIEYFEGGWQVIEENNYNHLATNS